MRRFSRMVLVVLGLVSLATSLWAQSPRWSEVKANSWYQNQPWLVGGNFVPADAINQLEMWQADTFDSKQIDREFGWAEGLGMNTMRVFLHDLPWLQDAAGFQRRIDTFLTIAAKHHIRPILVLFDSCWDPNPHSGPQHPPIPGVHNSGWVQSPGAAALADESQYPRLKAYVRGVVGAFANDSRILAWDLWNEPENENSGSYPKEEPKNKVALVRALLPQVFEWARSESPSQPLTSGLWLGKWATEADFSPGERIQIEQSDIITFHDYSWPELFEQRARWLERYHRPIICTEYMARSAGSTFDTVLPIAKRLHIGAINWGLVRGRTQTNLPWDSWTRPYVLKEPTIWFHDIFYEDGRPYRAQEVKIFRELTGKSASIQ